MLDSNLVEASFGGHSGSLAGPHVLAEAIADPERFLGAGRGGAAVVPALGSRLRVSRRTFRWFVGGADQPRLQRARPPRRRRSRRARRR